VSFLTVCLHPVIQRTYELACLRENQVNRCLAQRVDASGKGVNVSRVLVQLGQEVVHLTQAGGSSAEYFLRMAHNDGLDLRWVDSQSEIRTCCSLLNRSTHTSTEIVEEAEPVGSHTDAAIRALFFDLLPSSSVLIISGTKASGFLPDLFPWMVQTAKSHGAMVVLDYRGAELLESLPFRPDIIKPNRQEFMDTFFPSQSGVAEKRIHEKMVELQEQDIQVVLTDGAGPVLYTLNNHIAHCKVPILEPVNAIGSGDAFTAGLAAAFQETHDLTVSVEKAVWCGCRNAQLLKPGVIR
jgi:1-phosphofructokinase family hexose kinase